MNTVMKDLNDARARRLLTVFEIVEVYHSTGEPVDVDAVTEVITQGLEALGPDPDNPRPLDEQEERALIATDLMLNALCNLAEHYAGMERGKMQRQLLDLRSHIFKTIIFPRMQLLSLEQRTKILAMTCRWGYTVWSPWEQQQLLQILERAAEGRYMGKDLRAIAAHLAAHFNKHLPALAADIEGGASNEKSTATG